MKNGIQLLGISNAIVDVLSHCDEDFLKKIDVLKGGMTLIDKHRATEVYALMGPATEMSGGSVANTIAGFANLGGKAGYIGRVADDQLGHIFVHDMQSLGIDVKLAPMAGGEPTACCYVLITPDGQRSMQTFLGACVEINGDDITDETIDAPQAILLEGYIWDTPKSKETVEKAIRIGKESGAAIALSLSDDLCVDRHRESFMQAITEGMDLVFANEEEIISLLEVDDFDAALKKASSYNTIFALTRSEKGSVVVHGAEIVTQEATPIEKLVDSTGAGDAYTAGFLYSWSNGKSLKECAELGSLCAAKVIQQIGARIERDMLSTG